LSNSIRSWEERGFNVVIVGNGNAVFAEAFREESELESTLLIAPELAAYLAADLRGGTSGIASPKLIRSAFRAYRNVARQSGVEGGPWQLGGVFVVERGGGLKLSYRSGEAGDHASSDQFEASLSPASPSFGESAKRPTLLATTIRKGLAEQEAYGSSRTAC
jgi:hypothetical protein